MLTSQLPLIGIAFTRAQVVTELAWLKEQGLVETEETGAFIVATATTRGVEIARASPAIQRSSAPSRERNHATAQEIGSGPG